MQSFFRSFPAFFGNKKRIEKDSGQKHGPARAQTKCARTYSTVTLFARLRG